MKFTGIVLTPLLALGFISASHASDEPQTQQTQWTHSFEALHGETSDDAHLRSILLRTQKNRFDLSYPYTSEESQQYTYGAQAVIDHREISGELINGQTLSILGGRKFTPYLAFEAKLGAHREAEFAENATGLMESSATLTAAPAWLGPEKIFASLSTESGSAYSQLSIPVRDDHGMRASTTRGTVSVFPLDRLHVVSRSLWSTFSDRNIRNQYGADILYGIATDPLWIWIGVGAERMHNSAATGHYWSPSTFTQWGLRTEMSIPFSAFLSEQSFGARFFRPLAFSFGGSLSRIKEASFSTGSANYSMTALQWGDRNHANIRLSYERIRSEQNGNEWRSDAWMLAGQLLF